MGNEHSSSICDIADGIAEWDGANGFIMTCRSDRSVYYIENLCPTLAIFSRLNNLVVILYWSVIAQSWVLIILCYYLMHGSVAFYSH